MSASASLPIASESNTRIYQTLIRFLQSLGIPIIATLRDSQNYVRSAELGVGVHEMKPYVVGEDVEQWLPLIEWLEKPTAPRTRDGCAGRRHRLAERWQRDYFFSGPQVVRMRSAQFL